MSRCTRVEKSIMRHMLHGLLLHTCRDWNPLGRLMMRLWNVLSDGNVRVKSRDKQSDLLLKFCVSLGQ